MKEILEKRKERERHILNDDGSITAEIYDKDIYYLDNGIYKECDDTIIDNGDNYENNTNRIKSKFCKEEVIYSVMVDDDYLTLRLIGNKPNKVMHSGNTISYKNVIDNIDIDYEIIDGNIKESIIINNANAVSELDNILFIVDTNLDIGINSNNILVSKNGKEILRIPSPFMIDANKRINNNVTYKLKEVDNNTILSIGFDIDWLESEDVVYPVIIDPTIINETTIFCNDAYINSSSPDTNYSTMDGNRVIVDNTEICRSLIKFTLPTIDSSCSVIGATMVLKTKNPTISLYNNSKIIYVHAMTSDWSESLVTWNNSYNNYDSFIYSTFIPSYNPYEGTAPDSLVDITKLVKKWYGGMPNYGVMIKCNDEVYNGESYSYSFYSKDYDYSHQTYNEPVLLISYRKQDGIQDYMDYNQIDYSQGSSYINNYNGNIVNIFYVNNTVGAKIPANLKLVHNSSNHVWRFNYEETLTLEVISGVNYIKYINSTGATIYFKETNNEYKDEDGYNYTIKLVGNNYELYDSKGNIKVFESNGSFYRLKRIVDVSNNELNIYYSNGQINRIVDSSSNELNIQYNTNSIIVVSDSDTVTITKNNDKVVSISTKRGITSFIYNNYNLISQITDITGLYYTFSYLSSVPYRVSSICSYGLSDALGKSLTYSYDKCVTKITDNKNRVYVNIYDNVGRLVNNYMLLSTSSSFKESYGINSGYNTSLDSSNNKENTNTIPIKYVENLLENSRLDNNHTCNFTYSGYIIETDDDTLEKELYYDPQLYNTNSIEYTIPANGDYTISFEYKTSNDIGEVRLYKRINNVDTLLDKGDLLIINGYDKMSLTGSFNMNDIMVLKLFPADNHADSYIRKLQVETGKTPSIYNMVDNSGFNNGINYWNVYGSYDSGLPWNNPYEIVTLPSGEKALKLYSNPEGSSTLRQDFSLAGKEGDLYHISFWYKSDGIYEAGQEQGNMVNLQFYATDPEIGTCTHNLPLNYGIDEWQFFNGTYVAEADYDDFRLNFISNYECNAFYITDVMLFKDLSQFYYEYDSDGNLIKTSGLDNKTSEFKYDNNNQLISSFNPKGNNYKYEYDNNVTDRVLKGISPSGISNEIKYDSYGNPIKTIINNVNSETSYGIDGNYYIRLKGTNKYLIYSPNNGDLSFDINQCNIPYIEVGIEELYGWYLKFGDKYLGINQNNQIELMDDSTNRIYFDLIENDNGSYSIKWIHDDIYLYVDSNNRLNAHIVQMDESNQHKSDDNEMLFFEDLNTDLYIENMAEYTTDGRFISKLVDSLGRKTEYYTDSNNGLISAVVNSKNVITNNTYDNKNRISNIVFNNKQVDFSYNNNDKLSHIITGNKDYQFNYDNYLNLQSVQLNNHVLISHLYENNNGNLLSTTYGNNQSISYEYDLFDRLIRKTKGNKVYNYHYDNLGNISKISSGNEHYHFYYDYANRLAKYVEDNYISTYKYDINSNVTNKHIMFDGNEYDINYVYNSDDTIMEVSIDNTIVSSTYDYLGRLSESSVNNNITSKYSYCTNGNKTSLILDTMEIGTDKYKYKYIYDDLYNITQVFLNGVLMNEYEYDNNNQLVKDIDYEMGVKHIYKYDTEGNILRNIMYDLNDALLEDNKYEYGNSSWEDQLTRYNNKLITYDGMGNPLSFGDNNYYWINGRELSIYEDTYNDIVATYDYNIDGIRKQKTVNNVVTNYYLDGTHVLFEKTGNDVIYYLYDNKYNIIGFKYNNNTYYYKKNYQNDIIGIYDSNYVLLVSYKYDAFGKIIRTIDNSANDLASVNPFRYRSYYYDNETGMYYLNSRYYDPSLCRFINSDTVYNNSKNYNLYQYCYNNPIIMSDNNGNFGLLACLISTITTCVVFDYVKNKFENSSVTYKHIDHNNEKTFIDFIGLINIKNSSGVKETVKSKKESIVDTNIEISSDDTVSFTASIGKHIKTGLALSDIGFGSVLSGNNWSIQTALGGPGNYSVSFVTEDSIDNNHSYYNEYFISVNIPFAFVSAVAIYAGAPILIDGLLAGGILYPSIQALLG